MGRRAVPRPALRAIKSTDAKTWCFAAPPAPWRCTRPRATAARALPTGETPLAAWIAPARRVQELHLPIPYIQTYRYFAVCQRGSGPRRAPALAVGHRRTSSTCCSFVSADREPSPKSTKRSNRLQNGSTPRPTPCRRRKTGRRQWAWYQLDRGHNLGKAEVISAG